MGFDFTPSQRLAIESRGSAVLVSAAAGSGKTRVLTQRLIERVSDLEAPVDIDRFLVITYTRAAAAELRGRIVDALGALAANHPENRALRRQQDLCYRAPIGTIHSFCTDLLRENCHLLGLSPAFTVLDEDRAEAMKASALTKLLEKRYETVGSDPGFRLLADTVGAGRDDSRLQKTALELYEKIRSHPYPERWAREQAELMDLNGVTDVAQTPWGRELMNAAVSRLDYWLGRMRETLDGIDCADEKISAAYGPSFKADIAALEKLRLALDAGWDAAGALLPMGFERLGTLRNYQDTDFQSSVKAVRDGCKKAMGELADMFAASSERQIAVMRSSAPAMKALLALVTDFDRAYSAEKRRLGCLDFSDLEHFAARLLVDEASGLPTWLAKEYSQRFAEIMVDEYQDVNAVQDMIFRALSRDGTNLFMVGDVKQSIYRFRLADPGIFLEKYRSFVPAERASDGEPRVVLMGENFRSRRSVLDAVNCLFTAIMSRELGELDYDEAARLRFGSKAYPEGTDSPVEFCPIEYSGGGDDEAAPLKTELEAEYVARRILAMMRGRTPVTDGEGSRPCRWSDFAVLTRGREAGKVFHRVLSRHGIPVLSSGGGGFFTSLEVTVAINLLAVIDNPHADVPLISVLRSPVFGFTADELSAIRGADKSGDFYTALVAAARAGDAHCAAFLEKLGAWRSAAPDMGVGELIWRVCSETGLFAVCSAMSDGPGRRQNLMRLFEYAQSFTQAGYRGVFRFVPWLRRMAERGVEPQTVPDMDAVNICTIHKSKGLEYPFVFLGDLSRQFNRTDLREPVLVHPVLGLGPKLTDTERGIEFPTLARRAIDRRLTTELLSEEMRVLYVAMTRAREKLIMTCVWKDTDAVLQKLRQGLSEPVAPELLRSDSSFSKWIARGALLHPECISLRKTGPEARDGAGEAGPDTAAVSDEEAPDIAAALDFAYPRPELENLPSKLTATELKRLEQPDADSFSIAPARPRAFRAPDCSGTPRLSAAERGTAAHRFLQFADFVRLDSLEGVRAETERLRLGGYLSEAEATSVDAGMIQRLFCSPLGRDMASAAELRREFPFTLLCDAADFFPVEPGEELLLQGIVDCFFIKDGAISVVDYKTDRVPPEGVPARAAEYKSQLLTYARALKRICGLPVSRASLFFLHCGVEYPVDLENI